MNFRSKLKSSSVSIFSKVATLAQSYDAINLGQGFPNFDCSDELKDLVNKFLYSKKNQYAPMAGVPQLRTAISDKIKMLYKLELDPDSEICITAGATQAIFTIMSAFIHSGDEVIVIEPAYDSYKPSITVNGGVVVGYELKSPDYRIDWDEFETLISDRTRMIVFNNPHNPMGMIYSHEDLCRLEKLVLTKDILVLSDEVYEHLVYDGRKHNSVMLYPELFKRSLAVFSFGKSFHVTGWKIGYCVAPKELMKEFKNIHQWNVFSVNSFIQYAIAEYMNESEHFMSLAGFYQKKRDIFANAMKGSRFDALACEGSYFQLYDYSKISELDDTDFVEYLVREFQIASIPVSVFYSSGRQEHMIRFCFAKTEDQLVKAAEILVNI